MKKRAACRTRRLRSGGSAPLTGAQPPDLNGMKKERPKDILGKAAKEEEFVNSLNKDLRGKRVVLRGSALKAEFAKEAARTVDVTGGFGATANTLGQALFVVFPDGRSDRVSGDSVERIVGETPSGIRRTFEVWGVDEMTQESEVMMSLRCFSDSEAEEIAMKKMGHTNVSLLLGYTCPAWRPKNGDKHIFCVLPKTT